MRGDGGMGVRGLGVWGGWQCGETVLAGLMASVMDEFETFVRGGCVLHPGHEVLDWMFGRVVRFAVARLPQFPPQRSV